MPCKNPLIPLDNSKKNIEEKIAGIFNGFEMPVSENDWQKISEALNSDNRNNDFESQVKEGFAGFEMPLNQEEDLWSKIQGAVNNTSTQTLEENVAESFSTFKPKVTQGDWISIKLGLWLGKFSRYLIPSILIAGFLSLVLYKHAPVQSTHQYPNALISELAKTKVIAPLTLPDKTSKTGGSNTQESLSDNSIALNNNLNTTAESSAPSNLTTQAALADKALPSNPQPEKKTSGNSTIAPPENTTATTNSLSNEKNVTPSGSLLWLNPFSKSHIPSPAIYNKNYWILEAPENATLKQELIRPFNPPHSFSNYFVEAGLGYGNLHTNTKNENPSFRGMTLTTQKNTGQLKLNLAFGYRFLFGKSALKIGVGADLTMAGLNSNNNPYMKYQLIRVIDSFMHVTLQKDTYWFARKWDTLNIEIKNAPRTSWIEIPVQFQHTFFKSANTELYGGLGLYPGKLVSSGGYVGNPYTSQPWTYWNHFYKNEPFNTQATALQAKQYLNNWRMGSGISIGLNQNLGYGGWIGVEAGYRKNGNIWRTNNVFLLRQQNNQYNIKLTMGLKF